MKTTYSNSLAIVTTIMLLIVTCQDICVADTVGTYNWNNNVSGNEIAKGNQFSNSEGVITTIGDMVELDGAGYLCYKFRPELSVGYPGLKPNYDGRNVTELNIYVDGEDDAIMGNGADIYITLYSEVWDLYYEYKIGNFNGSREDYGTTLTIVNDFGSPRVAGAYFLNSPLYAWGPTGMYNRSCMIYIRGDANDKTNVYEVKFSHGISDAGHVVELSTAGSGSVSKNPDQASYQHWTVGSDVSISASPSAGYSFSGWTGDVTGSGQTGILTIWHHYYATANFSGISNNPPTLLNTPSPINNGTDMPTNIELKWDGGDPDSDIVMYYVCLSETLDVDGHPYLYDSVQGSDPGVVSERMSFTPNTLYNNKTYHWQILAIDENNSSIWGPPWTFTTEAGSSLVHDLSIVSFSVDKITMSPGDPVTISSSVKNNGNYSENCNLIFELKYPNGNVYSSASIPLSLSPGTQSSLQQRVLNSDSTTGNYTAVARVECIGDSNPSDNYISTSIYAGSIADYTQYKMVERECNSVGTTLTDASGVYSLYVTYMGSNYFRADVKKNGSNINTGVRFDIEDPHFYDNDQFLVYNSGSDTSIAYVMMGRPNAIPFQYTPSTPHIVQGGTAIITVECSTSDEIQNFNDSDISLTNDVTAVRNWYRNDDKIEDWKWKREFRVPGTQATGTYTVWFEEWLVGDTNIYLKKLDFVIQPGHDASVTTLTPATASDFDIGDIVNISADISVANGYNETVNVVLSITGPGYSYSDNQYKTTSSTANAAFTWNTSGLESGSYSMSVSAIIGNDINSGNTTKTNPITINPFPQITVDAVTDSTSYGQGSLALLEASVKDPSLNSLLGASVIGTITWPDASITNHPLSYNAGTSKYEYSFYTNQVGAYTISVSASKPNYTHGIDSLPSITVNNLEPVTEIINPYPADGSGIQETDVTFNWTGNDTGTPTQNLQYAWKLDSGTFSAFSTITSTQLTSLSEGSHTFYVKAYDGSLEDSTPETRTFIVDYTLPVIDITTNGGTNFSTTTNTATILGTASDTGGAGLVSILINPNASNTGTNDNWSFNLNLVQGDNYIEVAAVDGAGNTTTDSITITYTPIAAAFPFADGFESGSLQNVFTINSTGNGRILVDTSNIPNNGTYHLLMDSSVNGSYALNELILTIDLTGESDVRLDFFQKEFNDDAHSMPDSFTDSVNADGVAVSEDGINWYRAVDLANGNNTYSKFTINLDSLCTTNGLSYNSTFQIKFQQYDNYSIDTNGFAFDDILIDNDSDQDGLCDSTETAIGTDPNNNDTDSDGLKDGEEVNTHFTNPLIADSDSDGLSDYDEVVTHLTDPNNTDSDSDGLSDYDEIITHLTDPNNSDSDSDGLNDGDDINTHSTDPNNTDSDGDGLNDYDEVVTYLTDPTNTDSDGDGLNDYDEVVTHLTDPNNADSDGDGMPDSWEITNSLDPLADNSSADNDGDGLSDLAEYQNNTDPNNTDSDSDGLDDGEEVNTYSTDPLIADSDSDGLTDYQEVNSYGTNPNSSDTDNDGMPDYWEVNSFIDPLVNDASDDKDGDGLTNLEEYQNNTHPSAIDTDSDGLNDYEEVITYLTDPNKADSDSDGLTDSEEINTHNTDPLVQDTDGDGETDGNEVAAGTDPLNEKSYPTAPLFIEDFESGSLASYWATNSTGNGRIQVSTSNSPHNGNYHLLMDSGDSSSYYALNELILTIDLAGQSSLILEFYHKDFDDETHVMPDSFTSSVDADGVAISNDGVNWYKAVDLPARNSLYRRFSADLDAVCTANGISYNSTFLIKFQQYDNVSINSDGFAFDNIKIDNDTDQDGFCNSSETFLGTDPLNADTDGDSLSDGEEVNIYITNPISTDSDGDTLPDAYELGAGLFGPWSNGTLDPNDANSPNGELDDFDSDGDSNAFEYTNNTDPTDDTSFCTDIDYDGIADSWELSWDGITDLNSIGDDNSNGTGSTADYDGDGLTDYEEYVSSYAPVLDPTLQDTDDDGLDDNEEINTYNTDPVIADTDEDSYTDGWEIANGFDPLDSASKPSPPKKDDDDDSGCAANQHNSNYLMLIAIILALFSIIVRKRYKYYSVRK